VPRRHFSLVSFRNLDNVLKNPKIAIVIPNSHCHSEEIATRNLKHLLLLYISFYKEIPRCARDDNSDFLRRHQPWHAEAAGACGSAKTFVVAKNDSEVVGYYSLTVSQVKPDGEPTRLSKGKGRIRRGTTPLRTCRWKKRFFLLCRCGASLPHAGICPPSGARPRTPENRRPRCP